MENTLHDDKQYELVCSPSRIRGITAALNDVAEISSVEGQYELDIVTVSEEDKLCQYQIKWGHDNKTKQLTTRYSLHPDLLRVILRELRERERSHQQF